MDASEHANDSTTPPAAKITDSRAAASEMVTDQVIGWAVLEWNQASGQPGFSDGYLERDREVAEQFAEGQRLETARVGRGERYAVVPIFAPSAEPS